MSIQSLFDPDNYCFGYRNHKHTTRGNFFKSDDNIKFFIPFSDTIYQILEGRVSPYIVISTDEYKMTRQDIEGLKSVETGSVFKEMMEMNKLNDIYDYAEFNNKCFFRFSIRIRPYYTLYDTETGEVVCTSRLNNDMAVLKNDLFMINDHQFASIATSRSFPFLKDAVLSGKMVLPEEQKEMILNISANDNPLIIIYDIRKDS